MDRPRVHPSGCHRSPHSSVRLNVDCPRLEAQRVSGMWVDPTYATPRPAPSPRLTLHSGPVHPSRHWHLPSAPTLAARDVSPLHTTPSARAPSSTLAMSASSSMPGTPHSRPDSATRGINKKPWLALRNHDKIISIGTVRADPVQQYSSHGTSFARRPRGRPYCFVLIMCCYIRRSKHRQRPPESSLSSIGGHPIFHQNPVEPTWARQRPRRDHVYRVIILMATPRPAASTEPPMIGSPSCGETSGLACGPTGDARRPVFDTYG